MSEATLRNTQSEPDHRTHLAIFLGTTWAIKNVVLTGLLKRLQVNFRQTVWVTNDLYEDTVRLAGDLDLQDIVWREIPASTPNRRHQIACRIQKGIIYERHKVGTEEIDRRSSRGRRSHLSRLASLFLKVVMYSPFATPLYNYARRMRCSTTSSTFFSAEFEVDRPDLVLLTNAVDRRDDPVYYEALERGIPQVNFVPSWDNLTSKGIIHDGLSRVLVWNKVMKQEVLDMYDTYRDEQVVEVGISRFDVYSQPFPADFEREPFMNGLGLDPSKRMMIFANTGTQLYPAQPQVIGHIIEAMHNGTLPDDLQLLIRLHPHDVLADYKHFREEGKVAIWPSSDVPDNVKQSSVVPPADDLWTLAASLRHSCLCINAASTMALDAAACRIPIISVAYDGDTELSFIDSIKSAYDYNHQLPFLQLDAVDLVESRETLIAAIVDNLDNPGKREDQRRAVRELFLGGDVSAVTRFEDVLRDISPASMTRGA
ncbi:MAG: hypothetical protein GY835_15245 [bacterium]|nr:hypothetical protein [bacterium]